MRRYRIRRIAMGAAAAGAGVVVLAAGLGASAQVRWTRTFDVPLVDLRASDDAALIERGRYLAYGPAHCAYCHTPAEHAVLLEAGAEPPMSGGTRFETPLGTFYASNITPDDATGIGRWSDAQIARALRHNVRPDGRVAMPFMEYQLLSDDDIVALLSFMRAQPRVRNPVPEHQLGAMGKVLFAYMMKPLPPPGRPPRAAPPADGSMERGEYVANAVASCAGCHSARDMRDGSYLGPRFAGGFEMESADDPAAYYVTPNVTPDPGTGVMAAWTEEQFVARFRSGAAPPGSHMPWTAYRRMSDDDLRALYRYLQGLAPVENETRPVLRRR
jgi:mono/diheme cytochrome c family protein